MAPQAMLPHNTTDLFLTDGGLETTLVFLDGYDIPYFAAFDLLKEEDGYKALSDYYTGYLNLAKEYHTGFVLESATWRANPDWIEKLGYPSTALREVNAKAIQLLVDLRDAFKKDINPIVISGCIGPRGDGYIPDHLMRIDDAVTYHSQQISVLRNTPVDLITAITMNYVEEAIGITQAANAFQLPVVISFTVETDGRLATGMPLQEAIQSVDESVTDRPLYYMINCSHPTHFKDALQAGASEPWTKRIKGIRANASCKSHAELDEATELDRGDPDELGKHYRHLKNSFPQLNVVGGCCGTDLQHIAAIADQLTIKRNGHQNELF